MLCFHRFDSNNANGCFRTLGAFHDALLNVGVGLKILYFTYRQHTAGQICSKLCCIVTLPVLKCVFLNNYSDFGLSYAKNGELLKYIRKIGSFDETCTRFYSAEIVSALEYLHEKGIIHRCVCAPRNYILCGFMCVCCVDDVVMCSDVCISETSSPRIFCSVRRCTFRSPTSAQQSSSPQTANRVNARTYLSPHTHTHTSVVVCQCLVLLSVVDLSFDFGCV